MLKMTEKFNQSIPQKSTPSLVSITQSYFALPETFRLNPTHYFIKRIQNNKELQQIIINESSDIDFKNFMYRYKKYICLVTDTTFASDNPFFA